MFYVSIILHWDIMSAEDNTLWKLLPEKEEVASEDNQTLTSYFTGQILWRRRQMATKDLILKRKIVDKNA